MASPRRRHAATVMALAGIVCGMVGLTFAAVPLYRVFCAATGYGGTTQRAAPGAVAADASGPLVTVRFDASIAADLGWEFRPEQTEIAVHPGEPAVATYRAVNLTRQPIDGSATYNVTPYKAGIYFDKVQCFCFTRQHLEPGESARLGVSFFVDPELLTDPATSDVRTITLSYTMFHAKDDGTPRSGDEAAKPVAQRPGTSSSSVN